jgi:hypothetical protein
MLERPAVQHEHTEQLRIWKIRDVEQTQPFDSWRQGFRIGFEHVICGRDAKAVAQEQLSQARQGLDEPCKVDISDLFRGAGYP